MLNADEALELLLGHARPIGEVERIHTTHALGRVLAQPLVSTVSVPPLDNSAMDGYAVACADLNPGGETRLRVAQRIPAGSVGHALERGTAARIFTGAPVPAGADAVVMQEDCAVEGDEVIVRATPKNGANIRRTGEDITVGQEILPAGVKMRPQEMGLIASIGLADVPVYRKLRVALFFTGDEIVMPGEPLQEGEIYNSNRYTLLGLLEGMGCRVADFGIVPDSLEATVEVLNQAWHEADLIVTSGGVSVGEEDYVKAAVERTGKLDMWKVAMKPGKPIAYGMVHDKTPFIGLPGNPVSAFATFCLFVRPFILRCQGVQNVTPRSYRLPAAFDWSKNGNRREFVRARLEPQADGAPGVAIYPNQGSGVLTSAVWGEGLAEIREGTTVARGDAVKFTPFSELLG
ncbi:molybdopterin molybdenumtransferase MoeA [Sulfurimicrobium lacus]|uniref:Molybdopterin molybdenumtransferase n=2 Tax=Sulfurimicrobium lacus TaxID=2715678 RepID=A0A6F8VDK6_9PROT|nr:molybdopterin molybdenumtransferase MoeA [Sulfurimicrobium lacus]